MASLIPRELIFGNPERASVRISPDGEHLAWLAPADGVLNVWVAPRDDPAAARAVTNDTGRGIRFFAWAFTNGHILYLQDTGGDENWRVYATDLSTGETRDLTPMEGIHARIQQMSRHTPQTILVALNDRDPQWHDLYRLDITTGERELVLENNRFVELLTDDRLRVRRAYEVTEDGGIDVFRPADDGEWTQTEHVSRADSMTTDPLGFDESGRTLYMRDGRDRDTAALYAVDTETGSRELLAEDARADLADAIRHPTKRTVQAAAFVYERKEWRILDESIRAHLDILHETARGEVEIASRSLDDRFWVVAFAPDNGPVAYYLYEPARREPRYLFTNRPALEDQPLVPMHSATITTRDGLSMVLYYSLPPESDSDGDGIPDEPLPIVSFPHGGPWARDFWGFNSAHQWLANRGYAVLSMNFRSSTGFGKAFINAGDRVWGTKVLEDQLDAIEWTVDRGIADRSRVGVMGGSFGGYSTLAGLTMHPEAYACGVDIVGPSNLITLLESTPEYWKPMLAMLTSRVGDHRSEEGRELLTNHSPLSYVDRIRAPLLIGQGANDPRVKQAESDQIVAAMQQKQIPVTYVLYPDEGHGFARPENRLSFYAIAEAFLARHLGGRAEPPGDDFENSSVRVPSGAEEIPGIPEALA